MKLTEIIPAELRNLDRDALRLSIAAREEELQRDRQLLAWAERWARARPTIERDTSAISRSSHA